MPSLKLVAIFVVGDQGAWSLKVRRENLHHAKDVHTDMERLESAGRIGDQNPQE